jgi:hypothetical protein
MRPTHRNTTIDPSGIIAWFDEALETVNLGPARGSGVLTRGAGGWKIEQYNLTITVPNERLGDVKRMLAAPR